MCHTILGSSSATARFQLLGYNLPQKLYLFLCDNKVLVPLLLWLQ